jgi:lysozyme family protein
MADIHTSTPTTATSDLAAEELRVKRQELAVRRLEARAKFRMAAKPWWRAADPLVLAVVAGILTLGGNTFLAFFNSRAATNQERTKAANALEVEKEKAKATLIIQAVSTDDPATARRNLFFFLDAGIIRDPDQKIRAAVEKYAPVLPSASGQPTRTPPTTPEAYNDAFWGAALRPEWIKPLDAGLSKITEARPRLEKIAQSTHTPWYVIGVFWLLETGGSFTSHLHNGDPLTGPTVHVPAGRGWPPPPGADAWEYSTADAISLYHLDHLDGLQVGEILARLERTNGMGYQKRGSFSPYLWAGTDLYEKGKFVGDHQFDPEATSRQLGVAALLRRLQDQRVIDLRGSPTASAQTRPNTSQ